MRLLKSLVAVSLILTATSAAAQPPFPTRGMEIINALFAGVNPQDDEARKARIKMVCEQMTADLGPRWGNKKRAGLSDDYRSPDSVAWREFDGGPVSVWDIHASSGAILVQAGKPPDYPNLPTSEATFMGCEPRNHMGGTPIPGPGPGPVPPPLDLSHLATKEDVAKLEQKIDAVKEDTRAVRSGMNKAWKLIGKYGPLVAGAVAAGFFSNPNDEPEPPK